MELLIHTARWEGILLFVAFAAVTMKQVLTKAQLSGLMRAPDGSFSPGTAQMLVLTILTAMQFLLMTIHDPSHMPVLPPNLVEALGGSQLVYLGAKAWATFN